MSKPSTAISPAQPSQASSTSVNGSSTTSASATPAPAINYAQAAAKSTSNSTLPPRHSYTSSISSIKGAVPPSAPKASQSRPNGSNGISTPPGSTPHSRKGSVSIRDSTIVMNNGVKPVPQRQTSTAVPAEGTVSTSDSKSTMFGSIPTKPAAGKQTATRNGSSVSALSNATSTPAATDKKPFDLHSFFQSGGSQNTLPASSATLNTPPNASGAPSPNVNHRKLPGPQTFDTTSPRISHQPVPHSFSGGQIPPQPGMIPQFPTLSGQPPFHGPPPFYPPNAASPSGQAPQMSSHPHLPHTLSTNARPWTPGVPQHNQSPTTNGAPPNPYGGISPATTVSFPQPPISPTVPHLPGQPYSPSLQHPGLPGAMSTPNLSTPPSPFPPHAKPPAHVNQTPPQSARAAQVNGTPTNRGVGVRGAPTSPRMQAGGPAPAAPPPGTVPQYWAGYQPYVYQPYYPPFAPTGPVAGPGGRPPTSGQPHNQSPSMPWQQPPLSTSSPNPPVPISNGKPSFNAAASEFRPTAPSFTPQSRPSKAILIKDPKTMGINPKGQHSKNVSSVSSTVVDDKIKTVVNDHDSKVDDPKIEAEKKAEEEDNKLKAEEEAKIAKQKEEEAIKEEEERRKKEEEDRLRKEEERLKKEEELKRAQEEEEKKKEEERKLEEERMIEEARKIEEEKTKEAEAIKKAEEQKREEQEKVRQLEDEDKVTNTNGFDTESSKTQGVTSLPPKPANGSGDEPSTELRKKRPGPLNLANTPKMGEGPAPLPSALATARNIEDLSAVVYPESIQSPRPELNPDPETGKFRYDREFLLQFMGICKEKPDQLPSLEAIGMVDSESNLPLPQRGQSFSSMGPPPLGRQPSGSVQTLPGGRYWRQGSTSSQTAMGMFQHAGDSKTDRFSSIGRVPSMSGVHGLPPHQLGRPSSLTRTNSNSQIPPGGIPSPTPNPSRRSNRGQGRKQTSQMAIPTGEYVAPLAHSADAWVPTVANKGQREQEDPESIEIVQRKVKSLLNKLTIERFDSISNQIIEWANKSENEKDGRILRQVIALIFEKATDEAAWSEMYAKLCRKMIEFISPKVVDEGIPEPNNKGGSLFRKYLLNRCQDDYERGWAQKENTAAAAASKAVEDKAKQAAAGGDKEAEILSDEYYAAQKAKRQGLGLVRFIGELFKLQMLTERIMHECIKKLLANIENPEEEDIESLCRLMTTVGQLIDSPKARDHMNIYFTRMKSLASNDKLSSRMRFMIQDVIDERSNGWKKRVEVTGPKSIAQIHQDAQKEKEEAAARVAAAGKTLPRMSESLPRGGSRRGQNRDSSYGVPQVGQDGWTSVGTAAPQRLAGDLSGMGKLRDASLPVSFGPTGVFTKGGKGRGNKNTETPSRSVSITGSSNRFDLLAAAAPEPTMTARRLSTNEPTPSASATRQKLQLAPRTIPAQKQDSTGAIDETMSDVSEPNPQAAQSIKNSVAEFFSVKDIQEGVANFTSLESRFQKFLIRAMTDKAISSRQADVELYGRLLEELLKGSVSRTIILEGFRLVMPTLVDVAVDVPSAWKFTSMILIAGGMTEVDAKALSELLESEDEDVDEAKSNLLEAFAKAQ